MEKRLARVQSTLTFAVGNDTNFESRTFWYGREMWKRMDVDVRVTLIGLFGMFFLLLLLFFLSCLGNTGFGSRNGVDGIFVLEGAL